MSFVIYIPPGDWADLLWPHKWSLSPVDVEINGALVYDYLFMLWSPGTLMWVFYVNIIFMFFMHLTFTTMMVEALLQQILGCYGKYIKSTPTHGRVYEMKYGDWVDMQEITVGGTYTLNPLQSKKTTCVKEAPNSDSEYFVVEYRKRRVWRINLPGSRSDVSSSN